MRSGDHRRRVNLRRTDAGCQEHRCMVLDLTVERGQRIVRCTNTVGHGIIGVEKGRCGVPHRGKRRTDQVDELISWALELRGPRSPHGLTSRFAACHGQ
jgi:hypothetical protein